MPTGTHASERQRRAVLHQDHGWWARPAFGPAYPPFEEHSGPLRRLPVDTNRACQGVHDAVQSLAWGQQQQSQRDLQGTKVSIKGSGVCRVPAPSALSDVKAACRSAREASRSRGYKRRGKAMHQPSLSVSKSSEASMLPRHSRAAVVPAAAAWCLQGCQRLLPCKHAGHASGN